MSRPAGNVTRSGPASRAGVFILGLVFVACTGALGALLGGASVRFLMPRAPDGWTGIAQGLGGLMTGGLIAIVVAIFLVVPLARRGTRALAVAVAATASAVAVLVLVLYLTRPSRPDQGTAVGSSQAPVISAACRACSPIPPALDQAPQPCTR